MPRPYEVLGSAIWRSDLSSGVGNLTIDQAAETRQFIERLELD